MAERREIDRLDSVLRGPPSPVAARERDAVSASLTKSQIRCEYSDVVSPPRQSAGQCPYLDGSSTFFLEWVIRLDNFQDAQGGIAPKLRNQTAASRDSAMSIATNLSSVRILCAIRAAKVRS